MGEQNSVALWFFSGVINKYSRFRQQVESRIAWSPYLSGIFNETLRVRRWPILQGMLKSLRHVLPNPIKVDEHILFHQPTDINTTLSFGMDHEPEVKNVLTRLLKPGMNMIDAGANIGYFTLLAARTVGATGHVYAFEPTPATVELLRKNIAVNNYADRVTVTPKALTDKEAQVRIYLDELASGVSSIFPGKREGDFVDVAGVSLDDFFAELDWPTIHIIKMDIEGAEKMALGGMKELCRRNPELKLVVELNLSFDVEALFEALLGCGFSRFFLLEAGEVEVNIPEDIPHIVSTAQGILVNLLCEKATLGVTW
jgi:FkbM family methyltransferase